MRYMVKGRATVQETCWHCDGAGHPDDTQDIEIQIEIEPGDEKAPGGIAELAIAQHCELHDLEDGQWDRPPEIEEIEEREPAPAEVMRMAGMPDLFSLVGIE